jgi:methanogenic corrinoid protein MtbC1
LISDDDKAAAEMIIGVRAEGMAPEDIYLKYLAASARMLGKWWEEDRVSFVDVTVGTGRMYAIMRGMKHHFIPAFDLVEKSAVFAAVPGETHTLGVRMAADLFRKDGWDIALKIGLDHDDLVSDIEKSPSSIVGLSVSGRHSVEALSRLVVALNICCPQAPLVVCGHDIEEIRPLLSLAGLDGVAGNVEEAKEQMDALWDRKIAS